VTVESTGSVPITAEIAKDVIRVNFSQSSLACKFGPYTIKFDVSDPDGCASTYAIKVTGTRPVFSPKPEIAEFTLSIS
jgi:hypothetical protein